MIDIFRVLALFPLVAAQLFIVFPMFCGSAYTAGSTPTRFKSAPRQSGPVSVQQARIRSADHVYHTDTTGVDDLTLLEALWVNSRYKDNKELLSDEERSEWDEKAALAKLEIARQHPGQGIEYLFGKGIFWFPGRNYLNSKAYDEFNLSHPRKTTPRRLSGAQVVQIVKSGQQVPPTKISQPGAQRRPR